MRISIALLSLILIMWLLSTTVRSEFTSEKIYVIVVSKRTLEDPEWRSVVLQLKQKYNAIVLNYTSSIWELKDTLSSLLPDYTCFVAKPEEARPEFVKDVHRLTRELDKDPYGDTIWAILTGYTAEDAMRIVKCKGLTVRRVLSGSSAGWLKYVEEGITTNEIEYNRARRKYANGTIVEFKCPTDRTEFLVKLLNTNRYDMFITSGHANHDRWQLHFPKPGLEGYFISRNGRLYGKTYDGRMLEIVTKNPKVYFGLGNCYIGSIKNENSMPLAWIHSGGTVFFTGYVIPEGPHSYQLGGIPAYFFVQDNYTWAEAFYANNQALIFDMIHGTPGTDPSFLRIDVDGAALYGEPALEVRGPQIVPPLYSKKIVIKRLKDGLLNITVKIVMNYDGTPGWNGKWGNRHPVILLPIRVKDIRIIRTNAYKAVVTDNFVLLYVWKKGDAPLKKGEERFVVFTARVLTRPVKIVKREGIIPLNYVIAIAVGVSLLVIAILVRKFIRKQYY